MTTTTLDVTETTDVTVTTTTVTADVRSALRRAAERDARTPHARLLVLLVRQLQDVTETLNELEDLGPDDCPPGLFTEGDEGPGLLWDRTLPGIRFAVESGHSVMLMDLDSQGMRQAEEDYATKHGVQVGSMHLAGRT